MPGRNPNTIYMRGRYAVIVFDQDGSGGLTNPRYPKLWGEDAQAMEFATITSFIQPWRANLDGTLSVPLEVCCGRLLLFWTGQQLRQLEPGVYALPEEVI